MLSPIPFDLVLVYNSHPGVFLDLIFLFSRIRRLSRIGQLLPPILSKRSRTQRQNYLFLSNDSHLLPGPIGTLKDKK